jgi:hypothetical protein
VGQVKVSSQLLIEYFDNVHEATVDWINKLNEDEYMHIVDESWDPPVTLSVRLVSVINDCLQHAGQAAYVHGLIKDKRTNS